MPTAKIAITLDQKLLQKIDQLVKKHIFPNRSKVIQCALAEKIVRLDKSRLALECANLNTEEEQSFAEEGMSMELENWPEY
ncbi:hypothetical protein MNBD_BACTEROID05-1248 [hydrothermal vent metagenome]|uniref:Ribbon-helix-helix protein CopG domain-containing protein n=1 Tax=hydrothermal vent metagenome TaxID=652676 RepID=A0A3B0T5U1_9ZZZZ